MADRNERRTRAETVDTDRRAENGEATPPEAVGGEMVTTGDGVLAPNVSMADFVALGFSESATIKVGDPSEGDAVLAYAGEFIGPGPDIELNEKASGEGKTIPTWLFHPLNTKTLQAVTAITHKMICPSQLDSICKQLQAMKQTTGKRVQASVMWTGKGKNRMGQPLNKYRSAHRLLNDDGSVFSEKPANVS